MLPPLVRPQDGPRDPRAYLGGGWVAQIKLDGVRLAVVWGKDGRPNLAYTMGKHGAPMKIDARGLELPDLPPLTVVDGELAAPGAQQRSQAALAKGDLTHWTPFDVAFDPTGLVAGMGLEDRVRVLRESGLRPLPALPVARAWEHVERHGGEGIVVRRDDRGYDGPCIKIKPERLVVAILHMGVLFVLNSGRPHRIGHLDMEGSGRRVVVDVEGVTEDLRVRSPRFVEDAPLDSRPDISQLHRLRRGSRPLANEEAR